MGRGQNILPSLLMSQQRQPTFEERPLKPIQTTVCKYHTASPVLSYESGSLIVLAGPSGIGKSTWGKKFFAEDSILSSDQTRLFLSGDESNMEISGQAFLLINLITAQRLVDKQTTIIDSTALSPHARNNLVLLGQFYNAPVHLILLEGSQELCFKGQELRERKVPEDVILDQLAASLQLKSLISSHKLGDEGFSSALSLDRNQSETVQEIRCN